MSASEQTAKAKDAADAQPLVEKSHPNLAAALVAIEADFSTVRTHQTPAEVLADIAEVAMRRQLFNPRADRGQPLHVRFHNRYCEISTGCWIWISTLKGDGFGSAYAVISTRAAHRVALELEYGSVPDRKETGLVVDHRCRNKFCVNPYHLEVVTQLENVRRHNEAEGVRQYATHCVNGHEFTPETTIMRPYRRCLICEREINRLRARRRRAAQKAARP